MEGPNEYGRVRLITGLLLCFLHCVRDREGALLILHRVRRDLVREGQFGSVNVFVGSFVCLSKGKLVSVRSTQCRGWLEAGTLYLL